MSLDNVNKMFQDIELAKARAQGCLPLSEALYKSQCRQAAKALLITFQAVDKQVVKCIVDEVLLRHYQQGVWNDDLTLVTVQGKWGRFTNKTYKPSQVMMKFARHLKEMGK